MTTPEARRLLEDEATVILLDVSPEIAAERVGASEGRPLLADDPKGRLAFLASERSALYRGVADVVVDVNAATPEQVATTIEAALGGIS